MSFKRRIFLFLLVHAVGSACLPYLLAAKEINFSEARRVMVTEQLQGQGIRDRGVLSAMGKVPRELFVPPAFRERAYEGGPLPIGEGQTISQPYIVALMTELLELDGTERVLEIGTGSGYHAAILAELAKEVYTIEILPALAKEAKRRLLQLGYHTIEVKRGDGYLGWPEKAPFDAILLTAAPKEAPQTLLDQLKEGGILVAPLGPLTDQTLFRFRKKGGRIIKEEIVPVRFVPMVPYDALAR